MYTWYPQILRPYLSMEILRESWWSSSQNPHQMMTLLFPGLTRHENIGMLYASTIKTWNFLICVFNHSLKPSSFHPLWIFCLTQPVSHSTQCHWCWSLLVIRMCCLLCMFHWHFSGIWHWFLRQWHMFRLKFHGRHWSPFWTHWIRKVWMSPGLKATTFPCLRVEPPVTYLKTFPCEDRPGANSIILLNSLMIYSLTMRKDLGSCSALLFHTLNDVSGLIAASHL